MKFFGKGVKSVEEILRSGNVADRAGKMLKNDASAAQSAQVEREIAKIESTYKGRMKLTKGQKAKAEIEYLDDMNALEKGVQKATTGAESTKMKRRGVNALVGLGLLGGAGYAYNEKQKRDQRAQLINSLRYPHG